NGAAGEVEERIAGICLVESFDEPLHESERCAIERQRQESHKPHADLHLGEVPYGTGNALDAPVYPQAAERQAEKEGAEHQFEGMGGTSQDEAQHPDPADFIDE